jgi:hypothetical protein
MAREIGGRADKDGNEFERLWLVSLALRVLAGEATSLLWERAGQPGFGIECEVTFPHGRRQVHQCKIENGAHGRWSAADLAAAGVLDGALRHLRKPRVAEFVFVSRDPVPVLRDLAERSHRSDNDPESFLRTALTPDEHRRQFARLCEAWELDPATAPGRDEVFLLLQRLRFEIGIWDPSQRDLLELTAALTAEGPGSEIVSSLAGFLAGKLGNEIYGDQIREHLRASGHAPRDLRGDRRLPAALEHLRETFESSLAGLLLGGDLLPRPETQAILQLLDDPAGPRVVFLHGPAGIGKSDVELELTRTLAARGTPFLPIRLDSQPPTGSLSAFSRDVLELPGAEPAFCLAALADGRPAVLILDQLDALRWTGEHSAAALRICKEIVAGATKIGNLRVVLACRTFDLDSDPTFKAWERELAGRRPGGTARIEVRLLSDGQVENFVAAQGGCYTELGKTQRQLLRHPYTLFLWWSLFRERGQSPAFVTKTDLLSAYRRRLDWKLADTGQSAAQLVLDRLVGYLDSHGRLDAPLLAAGGDTPSLAALQSLNVLSTPRRGIVTFTHQSLLDYLIAERVAREALAGERTVMDWLCRHEQSLFRRDQLRQLLTLLRDQDPPFYIATLGEILTAEGVRFHLQHLALGMLRSASQPLDDERRLCERLLSMDSWWQHVLEQVVLGNQAWFEALDDAGLFGRWFESRDDRLVQGAVAACRSVAAQVPERIERLLAPHWQGGDDAWRERIDRALGQGYHELTDTAFGWRIELVRTGVRPVLWFHVAELARRHAARAIVLAEAHLAHALDRFEASHELVFEVPEAEREALAQAVEAAPEVAWGRLLPILLRSLHLFRDGLPVPGHRNDFLVTVRSPIHGFRKLHHQLRVLLARAGSELARREGLGVIHRLAPLLAVRSRCLRRLVLDILLGGPDELADFALQWLVVDARRLQLGSHREGILEPARRLVERFAGVCSAEVYQQLEEKLRVFHANYELRGVRTDRQAFRPLGPLRRSGYGKAQHVLLSALPPDRMSQDACRRLAGWILKFGKPTPAAERGIVGEASPVRSSIPTERLPRLGDRAWRSILQEEWRQPTHGGRQPGITVRGNRFMHRSEEEFARDFGEMARWFPARFAALLLSLPPSVPAAYLRSYLTAIAEDPPKPEQGAPPDWTAAPVAVIESVLEHFADHLQDRGVALALCRLVEKRASDPWSERTICLIRTYTEYPDPLWARATGAIIDLTAAAEPLGEPRSDLDRDLSTAALNCVPGAAAGALMRLLYAAPERTETCLPTIERLVAAPDPAVRVAAQGLCLPLLRGDRDRAVQLFVHCCDHPDDRVLAGMYVMDFLHRTWKEFAAQLAPVLARMVASSDAEAAELGAFWVTVGHIAGGVYSDLAASCLQGDPAQRKGAGNALALLAHEPEWRQAALPGIAGLFSDPEPRVVAEVIDPLRQPAFLKSPDGPALAAAFVESPAFASYPRDLFYGLAEHCESLVPYAPAIQRAVARFADQFAAAPERAINAWTLPPVLLRLYEQAEGPALKPVREACLDAWDLFLRGHLDLGRDLLGELDA